MAKDAANDITYYVSLDNVHKELLAAVRHWPNLKMGAEEQLIWIKDLDYTQIRSTEIQSIPSRKIYYTQVGKLFLLNSLLPDRNIPVLLWIHISNAISVTLPSFNHHYFGVQEKVQVCLIPSEIERASVALMTDINTLQNYLLTAPLIRLRNIKWVIIDDQKVLLTGSPLLPVNGVALWQRERFLIPAGYDLEFSTLYEVLNQTLNPNLSNWVIWNSDASYFLVAQAILQPLDLSSFRLSVAGSN